MDNNNDYRVYYDTNKIKIEKIKCYSSSSFYEKTECVDVENIMENHNKMGTSEHE